MPFHNIFPKTEERKEAEKFKIKTKIIVFSQYRETGTRICKELNSIPNINAKVFVGQAKKTSDKGVVSGLNQKEQQEVIEKFKQGKINCMVSTSIGEEGLDLPEINTVIFYEPIPSAIRKIQRMGRTARLKPGKLIILMLKKTLDEAYYWSAFHKEKKMYKSLDGLKEELKEENNKNKKEENKNAQTKTEKSEQKTLF